MSQASRFEARLHQIRRFYEILADLEVRVGGKRRLGHSDGHMSWPQRGVYFFFEPGEVRTTSGSGPRCVRVGTHGLKAGSSSTLWGRLRQHRGTLSGRQAGGGNHRGSVFRLHVGTALLNRDDWPVEIAETWGVGSSAKRAIREREVPLERAVSEHIRSMPFLWVGVNDPTGPESDRGYIERNALALLSNFDARVPVDPPSEAWLGLWAHAEAIRRSGLWNVNHVAEEYDPAFIEVLKAYVSGMG